MKLLSASLLGLFASTATAFAPNAASPRSKVELDMAKVPCNPPTPLLGKGVFVGETEWDLLTTKWGSEATGKYLMASELKHGRSAMLAVTGFLFHKLGLTLDKISPHEYLSVTQGVKFADLAAMSPVDAIKAVPPEGLTQMFCAIALVEFYELTHKDGKFVSGETVAPGLQPGGLTGDLGWNPLGIEVTERRKLTELQNGRAAMFAISAWVSAEVIQGSVPIPLLW